MLALYTNTHFLFIFYIGIYKYTYFVTTILYDKLLWIVEKKKKILNPCVLDSYIEIWFCHDHKRLKYQV